MSDRQYVVGIDLGTTNAKAVVLDAKGTTVAHGARAIGVLDTSGVGSEQDPAEVWEAVAGAVGEAVAASGVKPDQVAAVACCGQYSSIVPVDAAGVPTANLILYRDGRGGDHSRAIHASHPDAFMTWLDRHGIPPLDSGMESLAHILHVQHDRPEVHAATSAYLEPVDFVNLQLTGRAAANQCSAFMLLLTDNRTLEAKDYDADLVAMAGVDPAKLPELVAVDAVIGTVRPEVAERLGLSPDTEVFAGLNDTQGGAVATGTFAGTHGGFSIGTTSVLLAHVDFKHTDVENSIVSMPSPLPGRYVVMAENGIGGAALDHVLRSFVFTRDGLGDHRLDDPFAGVDATVEAVAPGSGDVLFLPWLTGSLSPDINPAMRGGFLNLSLGTTRAHLLRAVLEGVAFNARWLLPGVDGFVGHHLDHIVTTGGGAASPAWMQILADVLGRPVRPLADPSYGGCRGAALLALHRLGVLGLDDLAGLTAGGAAYEPRAEYRETYDRLAEQFVAAFEATRPICEALNS